METTGAERELFADAAIAADDMSAFHEFVAQGGAAQNYVLFGHRSRCRIFEYLVRKEYGGGPRFTTVSDKKEIGNITIQGVIAVAKEYIQKEDHNVLNVRRHSPDDYAVQGERRGGL